MSKSKFFVVLALILYLLSVIFQIIGKDTMANYLKSSILPIVTLLYFLTVKKKTILFSVFLVLYSISDLMVFIRPLISYKLDYFLGNSLYIFAYIFLVLEVCKSMSFYYIFKNYKIHLIVLTILNAYIIYVLQVIVDPFVDKTNEFYIELIYNIVMLLLLTTSLLNYCYKDSLKALYLFLGSLCIVFGEVIWVAYAYISERNLLNVISITLYSLAFYFYYRQSKLAHKVKQDELSMLIN